MSDQLYEMRDAPSEARDVEARELKFLELDVLVKQGYIASLKDQLFRLDMQLRRASGEAAVAHETAARLQAVAAAKEADLDRMWVQKNHEIQHLKKILAERDLELVAAVRMGEAAGREREVLDAI